MIAFRRLAPLAMLTVIASQSSAQSARAASAKGASPEWAVDKVVADTVSPGIGRPVVPGEAYLVNVEVASHYTGATGEAAPPAVRIIGASGTEYGMMRGLLSLRMDGLEFQDLVPWLQSAASENPMMHAMVAGTALHGIVYSFAVPRSESLKLAKLKYGDARAVPLMVR